jgi:hypothetical protein
MSYYPLIGSIIITRYKKNVSCASKIYSPSILSYDTKRSKVSEKADPHYLYPKTDFEGYRNNAKKEFEENNNYIGEVFHQEPDHPSTFMEMVKERTRTISVVNDERLQVLPLKVIWDVTINRFEVFRDNVEGHY